MTATNGFGASTRRLIGCCLTLALIVSAAFASSAGAKVAKTPTNYIALGDSVSFGYSQEKFEANYPAEPVSAYEEGYVNILGKKLAVRERASGNGLTTLNLSCPGEVSDGLIGTNPALGGNGTKENGATHDGAPCAWHNLDGFALHLEYGSVSQLEEAIGIVTTPGTFGTTKWVTTQIGSNDELAVVSACESTKYEEERNFTGGLFECLLVEAGEANTRAGATKEKPYYEHGLFHHIIANTGDEIGVLRNAGYTGEIGILGFYNPQAIVLPGSDALQKKLNETMEEEISGKAFGEGVVYANPFRWINPQKGNKVEQAAICKYTEYCNEHDKKANLEKSYEEHGASKEEAEAKATPEAAAAYPAGDIHPSPKGHALFAKILAEALTTGKSIS